MSKIKILLDIIADLNSLAESLKEYAMTIESNSFSNFEEISIPSDSQEIQKPDAAEKTVSRADVRARLANLTRNGYSNEVRVLLQKHGAERLSEIDDTELPVLMKEAEEIGE